MRRLLRVLGFGLIGLGVLVALFPVLSVWRVSGQVLDELPQPGAVPVTDQANRFGRALFDGDFVLATRTYEGLAIERVESALAGSGFERSRVGQQQWWMKECCGEYDAVMVDLAADESGNTVASVTVFDSLPGCPPTPSSPSQPEGRSLLRSAAPHTFLFVDPCPRGLGF